MRWDRPAGDAIFHVEWRFTKVEGKKGYNSGIYARNSSDAAIWHQAQTGDGNGGYLFGSSPINGKPKGFNLGKPPRDRREKPPGEWNTYELRCRGKEMVLWVNGRGCLHLRHMRGPDGRCGPRGGGLADRVPEREAQAAGGLSAGPSSQIPTSEPVPTARAASWVLLKIGADQVTNQLSLAPPIFMGSGDHSHGHDCSFRNFPPGPTADTFFAKHVFPPPLLASFRTRRLASFRTAAPDGTNGGGTLLSSDPHAPRPYYR